MFDEITERHSSVKLHRRLCADFLSYILDMNKHIRVWLRFSLVLIVLLQVHLAWAQFTPLIEVQGETLSSPLEGQSVNITGKVTEFFGETWYMQDAFGAWNGIYVVGPDVSIASNPPYWSGERQPEVGDVLEITGTVVEVEGNTTIMDAVLTNFVDFWNATPMGILLTADAFQDEQYEGTRVRIDNATVLASPDAEGYWTVSDGTGEVTCWGIDTDDPSNNEDPDGPTPGDVYQVYGAMHQLGETYVLHVGDIDVLALDLDNVSSASAFQVYPNPVLRGADVTIDCNDREIKGASELKNSTGQTVLRLPLRSTTFQAPETPGIYWLRTGAPRAVRLIVR